MKVLAAFLSLVLVLPLGSALAIEVDGKFVCTDDAEVEMEYFLDAHNYVQENIDSIRGTEEDKQAFLDGFLETVPGQVYLDAKECVLSFSEFSENDVPHFVVPEFGPVVLIVLGTSVAFAALFARKFAGVMK